MTSTITPSIEGLKAYTVKQLAGFYGVSPKIFRGWLQPHKKKIGDRKGHFYNALQVQVILEQLGIPGAWKEIS